MKITAEIARRIGSRRRPSRRRSEGDENPFARAMPAPGVVPKGAKLAFDDEAGAWAAAQFTAWPGRFEEGLSFIGFPALSVLAQRAEYRRVSEVVATEMTRKWIKIKAKGDVDKTKKVDAVTEEFERLNVSGAFRDAAMHDGQFGRSHIFLDVGKATSIDDRAELSVSIGDGRDAMSKAKVGRKSPLLSMRTVEPIWAYPSHYNSSDPLSPNWYRPDKWFVMGKEVHRSRLLTFVGREVPDILKPAFAFGGLSLTQMVRPAVDNWLRTRQSVSDIISNFSVMVLLTDMVQALAPGGNVDSMLNRIDMFNEQRDNSGTMALDKEREDFKNVSAPLGTLDTLQAQSQEHICSLSAIPVVKYTGIQPAGLNADSEGVVRVFYDWIHAYQVHLFSEKVEKLLGLVQLSLFGEVDPDVTYEFVDLKELDELQESTKRKTDAETDGAYVDRGVLHPVEIRRKLAADPDTPYAGLDVEDVPEEDDVDVGDPERGEGGGDPAEGGGGRAKNLRRAA